jgi:hypothetical protein
VGSKFFVASYQNGTIPTGVLDRVKHAAFGSSLSEAARGFAYGDLLRAFAPFWVRELYRDRGEALERAWMKNAGCSPRPKSKEGERILCKDLDLATLQGWQEDVKHGIRPAVIFNATTVETGQRLAFATAPYSPEPILPKELDPSPPVGVIDFSATYSGADILISTAARLSSTFTYVSPAARPLPATSLKGNSKPSRESDVEASPRDSSNLHLVDGGYHENSGLGALVAWLKNGLEKLADKDRERLPAEILIITVGAFPADKNPRVADQRGAIFQFEAPSLTLESMQGKPHTAAAWREFELLQEYWNSCNVKLIPVDFTFSGAQPPLSWHLRSCEKSNIIDSWEALPGKEGKLTVIDQFLS